MPVQSVAHSEQTPDELAARFDRSLASVATPPPASADLQGLTPIGIDLDQGLPALIWAPARAYADPPEKVAFRRRAHEFSATATHDTLSSLRDAQREIVLVSPYFIPGEGGMSLLRDARARGVTVRLITNSMASTDEPLVSAAYRRYRVPMLEAGVELYEISPTRLKTDRRLREVLGASKGGLHAKLAFADERTTFIGSMNLDPRSAWINTELGVRIDSAELTARFRSLPEASTGAGAYRIRLADNGRDLEWMPAGCEAEHCSALVSEPDVGWATRLKFFFLSMFVAEGLL